MNSATAEEMLRGARYKFQDEPRVTSEGCRVETKFSATQYIAGQFVGLVEYVTLRCEDQEA